MNGIFDSWKEVFDPIKRAQEASKTIASGYQYITTKEAQAQNLQNLLNLSNQVISSPQDFAAQAVNALFSNVSGRTSGFQTAAPVMPSPNPYEKLITYGAIGAIGLLILVMILKLLL